MLGSRLRALVCRCVRAPLHAASRRLPPISVPPGFVALGSAISISWAVSGRASRMGGLSLLGSQCRLASCVLSMHCCISTLRAASCTRAGIGVPEADPPACGAAFGLPLGVVRSAFFVAASGHATSRLGISVLLMCSYRAAPAIREPVSLRKVEEADEFARDPARSGSAF